MTPPARQPANQSHEPHLDASRDDEPDRPAATPGALPKSVEALAALALKQTPADGYAIYEIDSGTGERRLKLAAGVGVTVEHTVERTALRYSLGCGGCSGEVVFVCGAKTGGDRTNLERIARAIDQVWQLSFLPESYARQAARIGALEVELADSKIAERARGLLSEAGSGDGVIETIVHHVESVLRRSSVESTLAQFGRELETQIAERELTSRAKAVLQDCYGLSEEQAHVHLRVVSRTTRKRLRDVAQAVIANPVFGAKGLST